MCNSLWMDWMRSFPTDPLVIECKKRIATYSKEDWKLMSSEATYLTEMLGELVKYNIPHESHIAENGFDALVEHFDKWFFPINRIPLLKLAVMSGTNGSAYKAFFDGFYEGLGDYFSKLAMMYLYKIEKVTLN